MLPDPTTEEPTTDDNDGGPSSSGLSAAEIGGIVGGSVGFVVILIIVSLVIFFRCQPKKGKLYLIRLFSPFAVKDIENSLLDMFQLRKSSWYLIVRQRLLNGVKGEVWLLLLLLFGGNGDILIESWGKKGA